MKDKTLKELEDELEKLKIYHQFAWEIYGSELCPNEMIAKEQALEKEIDIKKQIINDENI